MQRVAAATGGTIQTSVNNVIDEVSIFHFSLGIIFHFSMKILFCLNVVLYVGGEHSSFIHYQLKLLRFVCLQGSWNL